MTPDVSAAAAANLGTHATWVQARAEGMRAEVTPRLSMGDSGLATDTFNIISGARLADRSATAAVRRAIAWYGMRPFSWWVSPGDSPGNLPALLAAAGLRPVEEETAMTCDLRRLPSAGDWPHDLTVTRARTRSDLEAYARLLAGLADPPDVLVQAFYAAAAPHLLGADSPLRLYLGRRDGTPVATAEVTLAHGVAGLYNVSTIEAERGRGIGTAMTVLPLLDARNDGIGHGVLQAAGDARRLYARVGFEAAGVVVEYKPDPAGEPLS